MRMTFGFLSRQRCIANENRGGNRVMLSRGLGVGGGGDRRRRIYG